MLIKLTNVSIKYLGVFYREELYQCPSVFAVIRPNIAVNSGQNFVVLFGEESRDCGLVFHSLTKSARSICLF